MIELLPPPLRRIAERLLRIKIITPVEGYNPYLIDYVDRDSLFSQISSFFNLERAKVDAMWKVYRAFSEEKHYATRMGERKTLAIEEAFIIYVILSLFPPKAIVEIGTQYGKSTRRIIDIKDLLHLEINIFCFDIANEVKYFNPDEARLILKDVTSTFQEDVLETYGSGFIYFDAHPYYLLRNAIQGIIGNADWIIAIHDCGRGLCNPRMEQSRDDPNISSLTGHWERHVLSETFGISDPLSPALEDTTTETHALKIFETPHGLAVIIPRHPKEASRKH